MNTTNEPFDLAYQLTNKLNFDECNNCSDCCIFPWVFKEEKMLISSKNQKNLFEIENTTFIKSEPKCAFEKNCRCDIYHQRPLDCRLYPLDLLELDGELWWCVFITCKKYKSIIHKIQAIIPDLEKIFTPLMLEQYSKQCKITNITYKPQRNKMFIKIQKYHYNPNQ